MTNSENEISEILSTQVSFGNSPTKMIEQEIKDREALRIFREQYSGFVKLLLSLELGAMVVFLLLQGFHFYGFNLDKYAFGGIILGVMTQTFLLMRCIIMSIFPHIPKIPKKKK